MERISWQALIPTLETVPRNTAAAALIVGFDGGSELLGHDTAEKFLWSLVPSATGKKVGKSQINTAWQQLDKFTRAERLRKHTLGSAPRLETIRYIADLLLARYITVVACCDPNKQLFGLLQNYVDIEPYGSSETCTRVLEAYDPRRLRLKGKAVLIDTSDVFIGSMDQGLFDLKGNERRDVKEALKLFSRAFDMSFFWGWCDYNIHTNEVWWTRGKAVYALGDYTGDSTTFNPEEDYTIVVADEHSREDRVSTTILDRIGEALFKAQHRARPSRGRSGGTPRPADLPGEEGFSAPPCLLWPDEELDRIRDNGLSAGAVVAGIEGVLVRLRVAARVFKKLRQAAKLCLWRVYGELAPLSEFMELLRAARSHYCGVVVIVPPAGAAVPAGNAIRREMDAWLRNVATANKKLFLFTPVEWMQSLEVLRESWPDFRPLALTAESCMAITPVQRWLQQLPALSAWQDLGVDWDFDGEARDLATTLVTRHREHTGNVVDEWSLDYFHQALDIWYDNICSNLQPDTTPPDDLESWGAAWDELLESLSIRRDQFPEDFELAVRRKPKPPEQDEPTPEAGDGGVLPAGTSPVGGEPPEPPPPPPDFNLDGLRKRPRP